MLRIATEAIQLNYEEVDQAIYIKGQNGIQWQHTFHAPIQATPSLLLPSHLPLAILAYGFDVRALDIRSGAARWQQTFDEPIWDLLLSPAGDLLIHTELSIVRLDTEGSEHWRYIHGEIITKVVAHGETILMRDIEEREFTIDLSSGQLQ